jgi:integrase
MLTRHLLNREGFWIYRRRVPRAYTPFDTRSVVTETTGIRIADDPRANRAARVAERINAALVAYWEGCAAGAQQAAKARYEEACRKARAMGVTYLEASELAGNLPTDQLLGRIERLERELAVLRATGTTAPAPTAELTTAALLGGVRRTTIPLSKLFAEYEACSAVNIRDKTPKAKIKWANKRRLAAADLLEAVGSDKDLSELTSDDELVFYEWWERRILAGTHKATTANSDVTFITKMIKDLNLKNKWKLAPVFGNLRFNESADEDGTGVPFSTTWIRDKLLAPGAFKRQFKGVVDLSLEARCAIYLMMETGLRPREMVMLNASTICLDADIPYVYVTKSKNKNSERNMPLVGVALAAMRLCPTGFPSYDDNSSLLSRHINDYFKAAGLREARADGKDTTLYSLRHAFKDRLRHVPLSAGRPGDELIDMLMGHSNKKETYGDGYIVQNKKEALDKIAFADYPADL